MGGTHVAVGTMFAGKLEKQMDVASREKNFGLPEEISYPAGEDA